ncbi:MAG: hypothetical protein H6767_00710 [Candidatus Peribacteria bacterium]|nr:MAG: hypothetical protein H6767_00710 [Candidatus Peribacteria bacterium]
MFYKKALVANTSGIKPLAFEMIGEIMLVIFCGMLLLLPWFSFEINGPIYHLFFLTFLAKLLSVLANPLYFKAYTHEKISVLMPFTSFDKIFGAVIGYLFLSGNSIWSVVCALGSVVLIIVFNVNAQ